MIRRNEGLNCSCINPTLCRNGRDYCNQIDSFTGKPFCEKIDKVTPIDLDRLNESIAWVNIMHKVVSTSKPYISGTKRTLTESLFEEDTKRDSDHRIGRYGETKNAPNRIRELIEMGIALMPVKLGHRGTKVDRPLPRKMTKEESERFVRACERLETLLDGTYLDVPPFCEENTPTDATRENQSPVWRIKE